MSTLPVTVLMNWATEFLQHSCLPRSTQSVPLTCTIPLYKHTHQDPWRSTRLRAYCQSPPWPSAWSRWEYMHRCGTCLGASIWLTATCDFADQDIIPLVEEESGVW